MGVIRWEEDADGKWQGHLGWSHVATAGLYAAPDGSDIYALSVREEFPGFKTSVSPYESIGDCKDGAEALIQEWINEVGLVSKAELDDANAAYSGLYTEFLARIDQALGLAKDLRWSQSEVDRIKRESKHRLDEIRDLQAENAVLKERIGAAFGDIDDAINALQRKATDIVYDLGIARTWSWDVPFRDGGVA